MNIANRITISRIILTFIFLFFIIYYKGIFAKAAAFIIFSLAALSDFLDGRIAKKRNIVSDFGKFMDPVADKILILAAFAAFVQMHLIEAWMLVIIIARELLITSLRLFALNKGRVLAASSSGKHKTAWQMFAIFWTLGFILIKEVMLTFFTWNPDWEKFFHQGIYILMWIVVGFTLYSGITYLWENRRVITKI
ncbi:MAG: CDP-diacylglycerol--glycerol-3-phosphate 3-phosphatidyltransferase [Candidatus Omnitrophica bacterium]|nr:CDP-diacylglycerol--glycerol-3-phosphate 3-phosphatidyltransferase [Candidatus Omnitrophota bacterium]MBU1871694.1 CDP-diacylglycerol--glycerol-3-phosphate 3-phosphatidyltransferase [Candidatus Omnitrophota bacterium]